jgi:phosphatidylglycerophosphate synthase
MIMLDPYLRKLIDPHMKTAGKYLAELGIAPNTMTLLGFGFGLLAMGAIVQHQYTIAACLIALNRLLDGLDGAIARITAPSDFGGVLDIVCDFIIYSGIVFAFGISAPVSLFYATYLIFSFIGPITTFLTYAIIAAKRQVHSTKRGIKSFYHLGGLCEGTETTTVLLLICLIPETFEWACIIYGGLCWITTFGRLYRSWVDFEEIHLPLAEPLIKNRQ